MLVEGAGAVNAGGCGGVSRIIGTSVLPHDPSKVIMLSLVAAR
jgi:hypothetical protein